MTRARALKQVIRARAAKTGERYTTARRHVLRELNQKAPVARVAHAAPASAKPTMSDASFVKKTGHDLAYWFAVLDAFGAVEKGHTAAARHLYEEHKVDGWYAQGITVSYERARGVRAANQRCDGAFEVSASKTVTATSKQLARAFTDARVREGRAVKLEGNPLHPVSGGRLCGKGQAAVHALYHPDRVRQPLRRTGRRGSLSSFEPASWERALTEIGARMQSLRDEGRPHSIVLLHDDRGGIVKLGRATYAATEGATVVVTILRQSDGTGPLGSNVSVSYATADVSATAGVDYTAVSGTVSSSFTANWAASVAIWVMPS